MELLELVLQTTYNNQQCVNRWNYVTNSTPVAVSLSFALVAAAGGIADAPPANFPDGTLFENIRVAVSTQVDFKNVQARNIYSVVDFYDTPVPTGVVGTQGATDSMAPFIAFGFVSSRSRSDIRRGTKRLVGVYEGAVDNGGVVNSTALALQEAIAAAMSADLVYDDEGSDITFTPCIVKKEKYTTPEGTQAYRYYPLAQKATQLANVATSIVWTPYTNVRSQTSRQYGRGR